MSFLSGRACLIQLCYYLRCVRLHSIPKSQKSNPSLDGFLSLPTSRLRHFVAQIPWQLMTSSLRPRNSVHLYLIDFRACLLLHCFCLNMYVLDARTLLFTRVQQCELLSRWLIDLYSVFKVLARLSDYNSKYFVSPITSSPLPWILTSSLECVNTYLIP